MVVGEPQKRLSLIIRISVVIEVSLINLQKRFVKYSVIKASIRYKETRRS